MNASTALKEPSYLLEWENNLGAGPKLPAEITTLTPIPLSEALYLLQEQGLIKNIDEYNPTTKTVALMKGLGWGELGRRLSLLVGGQVWPGSTSLTHNPGGRKLCTYFLPLSNLRDLINAKLLVEQLIEEPLRTHSYSGLARALLDWVGLKQEFGRPMEALLQTVDPRRTCFHYYHCEPGTMKEAALWDIKAAYFQLLCRLPSPLVYLKSDGKIGFQKCEEAALIRWHTMLAAIGSHKKLRNILTGCMSREGGGTFFSRGRAITSKGKDGVLRPAALTVIRATYELAALAQKQTKAKYSNTDCVITALGCTPDIWQEHGIEFNCQATGDAEIFSLGNYRVGSKATKWFWKGSRFQGPALGVEVKGASVLDFLRR